MGAVLLHVSEAGKKQGYQPASSAYSTAFIYATIDDNLYSSVPDNILSSLVSRTVQIQTAVKLRFLTLTINKRASLILPKLTIRTTGNRLRERAPFLAMTVLVDSKRFVRS